MYERESDGATIWHLLEVLEVARAAATQAFRVQRRWSKVQYVADSGCR
jgi:hypothetical protein